MGIGVWDYMAISDVRRVLVLSIAVEVEEPVPTLTALRTDPRWLLAIDELEAEVRAAGVKVEFVELEEPQHVERVWHVSRGAARFRCVICFQIFPKEGAPRFVGICSLGVRPVQVAVDCCST